MENKLAFFDFCGTIIKFQTADRFIDFCSKNLKFNNTFVGYIHKILNKLRILSVLTKFFPLCAISKRLKLLIIRGIPYEKLEKLAERYYIEELKPAIILSVVSEMTKKKKNGYKIWIVSGGYDIYIKYFIADFHLDGLIATQIRFNKKGYCCGRIAGIDCMNTNKVKMIEEKISNIKKSTTFAYSDSISDISLLKWVENGVVVSKNKSQLWAKKNNLEEIVWI
ncbi:MAG: HAD-IB family hydrolase [Prevotellaceae bacterium]|jgi:HAD superfamily hydrolase (TIGR01490 family)|nr:HAD-IB family hydrolase [Prevotellaceae bacterium]